MLGRTLPIKSSGWRYHLECMMRPVNLLISNRRQSHGKMLEVLSVLTRVLVYLVY